MSAAQTASYPPEYKTPQFAFLAKPPPPPQKKRPSANIPLPSPPGYPLPPVPELQRRRSNTFSSIAAWAAHVQPGSPAPRSPQRRPSITSTTSSRRPSITRLNLSRRPSITHSRARSGSFIHIIDTQSAHSASASIANFDLTAHGYTSVFVHLPKTPTTPSPLLRQYQHQHNRAGGVPLKSPTSPAGVPLSASFAIARIPIPPVPQEQEPTKRKGMKRFRSLSILRPKSSKGKTQPAPASPTKSTLSIKSTTKPSKTKSKPTTGTFTPVSRESKAEICAASIAQRKRAKYAYVRPPPPLANELAIMQFADGGSIESHIKRVMDAQAKAAQGSGALAVGTADVYRDANGGIWWDADEEMEYAHLLDGNAASGAVDGCVDVDGDVDMDMGWEEFDMHADAIAHLPARSTSIADKENLPLPLTASRRTSLSSQDSDLDPKYLLPLPENEDPRLAPPDERVLVSTRAGMSMLSLPARPRRRAMHLCKAGLLVDGVAWDVQVQGPRSPVEGGGVKPRGKARRRPAPLKLANANSSSTALVVVRRPSIPTPPAELLAHVLPSPGGVQRLRNEFIADSFEPAPLGPLPRPSLAVTFSTDAASSLPSSRAVTPNPAAAAKPRPSKMRGFSLLFPSVSPSFFLSTKTIAPPLPPKNTHDISCLL